MDAKFFCLALILSALPTSAHAIGDLTVAPTRLVFENRERTAEVTLTNTGVQPTTYRVMLVNRRMRADGSFEMVAASDIKPADRFANRMIRYTPKIITLPPGIGQTVRVQIRKPAKLDEGEYRSHLMFQVIPRDEQSEPGAMTQGFGVKLTPIYGVTIPAIIRHGETKAKAAISKPRFERAENGHELVFDIQRRGSRSIYGDLKVLLRPVEGEAIGLAIQKGLAVYTPNDKRTVRIPWAIPNGVSLAKAEIAVEFAERDVAKPQIVQQTIRFR